MVLPSLFDLPQLATPQHTHCCALQEQGYWVAAGGPCRQQLQRRHLEEGMGRQLSISQLQMHQ